MCFINLADVANLFVGVAVSVKPRLLTTVNVSRKVECAIENVMMAHRSRAARQLTQLQSVTSLYIWKCNASLWNALESSALCSKINSSGVCYCMP